MVSLPFTSGQALVRGVAVALSLALLCACSPRVVSSPSLSVPLEPIHDDPARDAQLMLLRETHRAFAQERYPTAVLFFRRYVASSSPQTPRLAEARWWLGRASEQIGDYHAAVAEYRVLAAGGSDGDSAAALYQRHALHRLDQLRQAPGGSPASVGRQVAVGFPVTDIPPVPEWIGWLQSLLKAGVTTIFLEPSRNEQPDELVADQLAAFSKAAHLAGLTVWGTVDPHHGRGLSIRPEWRTRVPDRTGSAVAGAVSSRTPLPDMVHPGYQAMIEARVTRLLQAGCDGILLRGRTVPGYAREYSDESFQRFAAAFGLTLTPPQLFSGERPSAPALQDGDTPYWRWAGWKARDFVSLVARLRAAVRRANPAGRLLVEVHGETVSEPLTGLEHYGEDLADLTARAGADLVLQLDELTGTAVLDQLVQQGGSADRLWMLRTVRWSDGTPAERALALGTSLAGAAWRNVVVRARSGDELP